MRASGIAGARTLFTVFGLFFLHVLRAGQRPDTVASRVLRYIDVSDPEVIAVVAFRQRVTEPVGVSVRAWLTPL